MTKAKNKCIAKCNGGVLQNAMDEDSIKRRERDQIIVSLSSMGYTQKQIAAHFNIHYKTVYEICVRAGRSGVSVADLKRAIQDYNTQTLPVKLKKTLDTILDTYIDMLNDPAKLAKLSIRDAAWCLGVVFDKFRIATDQSTSNVAVKIKRTDVSVQSIVDDRIDQLFD